MFTSPIQKIRKSPSRTVIYKMYVLSIYCIPWIFGESFVLLQFYWILQRKQSLGMRCQPWSCYHFCFLTKYHCEHLNQRAAGMASVKQRHSRLEWRKLKSKPIKIVAYVQSFTDTELNGIYAVSNEDQGTHAQRRCGLVKRRKHRKFHFEKQSQCSFFVPETILRCWEICEGQQWHCRA